MLPRTPVACFTSCVLRKRRLSLMTCFMSAPTRALAAARRYNQLARDHGMTPTEMALAFCYHRWNVTSTILGVTSVAQLDEDLNAWGTTLTPEVLAQIDAIRWELRDPAL